MYFRVQKLQFKTNFRDSLKCCPAKHTRLPVQNTSTRKKCFPCLILGTRKSNLHFCRVNCDVIWYLREQMCSFELTFYLNLTVVTKPQCLQSNHCKWCYEITITVRLDLGINPRIQACDTRPLLPVWAGWGLSMRLVNTGEKFLMRVQTFSSHSHYHWVSNNAWCVSMKYGFLVQVILKLTSLH